MHKIEAVFDGCCEPKNPGGHASYGAVVYVDGKRVYENSGYVGEGPTMSNNVAEFSGALDALRKAVEYDGVITLRGDSKLVIMLLQGRWKARRGLYVPYYKEALKIVKQHRNRMSFRWVPREQNSDCDELSKRVLIDMGVHFRIQRKSMVTFLEPRHH